MPLLDQKLKLPQIKILLKQYKDDKVKVLHLENVLVDSRASTNFISRSVIPQQYETIKLDQPITLTNAVRDEMSVLKYKLEANVCIPQDQIEVPCVDFTIIEDPVTYSAILGFTLMQSRKSRSSRHIGVLSTVVLLETKMEQVLPTSKSSFSMFEKSTSGCLIQSE